MFKKPTSYPEIYYKDPPLLAEDQLVNVLASTFDILKSNSKSSFCRVPQYHDEPRLFQYSARCLTKHHGKEVIIGGVGTSFSESKAKVKALGEAIERLLLMENSRKVLTDKPKNIAQTIDFSNLPEFYGGAGKIELDLLPWVEGFNLITMDRVLVPAQMVFVPYHFSKREPILRPPISTGAAAGLNYTDALLRGILEVIERDAFVLSYYQRSVNYKLDFKGDCELENIEKEMKRCELELSVFDISTDTGPYVFLAIAIDKTGFGPAVSAGLKAGYNPREVALGSIEEALHSRTWVRDLIFAGKLHNPAPARIITTIAERAIFWASTKYLKFLSFYLHCRRKKRIANFRDKSVGSAAQQLRCQVDHLRSLGVEIYFVDISRGYIETASPKVVKVITTKLQPLYLDDRCTCLSGPRITVQGKELNNVPHFFL